MTRSRRTRFRFRPAFVRLEDRLTPVNLYVNSSWVNEPDGTMVKFGETDVTIGRDAFADLPGAFEALDQDEEAATQANTVRVAEGTYDTGTREITLTVTVIGAGESETVIRPSGTTPLNRLFHVQPNGVLNLRDMTLDGAGPGGASLLDLEAVLYDAGGGGGVIERVDVRNVNASGAGVLVRSAGVTVRDSLFESMGDGITFEDGGGVVYKAHFRHLSRVGVRDHSGGVTVDTCLFEHMEEGGVRFAGAGPLSVLVRSSYLVRHHPTTHEIAVRVSDRATAVVSENSIGGDDLVSEGNMSTSSVGVQFVLDAGGVTSLALVGNEIQGFGVGLDAQGSSPPPVKLDAQYNNFVNNLIGVQTSALSFSAANCWWGGTTVIPATPVTKSTGGGTVTVNPPANPPNQVRFAVSSSAYALESAKAISDRRRVFAVGAGHGGLPRVQVRSAGADGRPVDFLAYHPSFTGGVRTAAAGSGDDTVVATAPGPGGGPHIKVFRFGAAGVPVEVLSKMAYHPSFTGGLWVALGDVTGDDEPDLVTGTGPGGGPHVKVFDGVTGAELASYFAGAATDRGGVTVAVADVDGDGRGEVVAGSGVGSTVRVLDALTGQVLRTFEAFESSFNGGVSVAAADLTGGGPDDLLVGAGAGGAPVVKGFTADGKQLWAHHAYDPAFTGGVNVEAADVDGDGRAELVTGPGPGGAPHLRAFDVGTHAEVLGELVFDPESRGGLNV